MSSPKILSIACVTPPHYTSHAEFITQAEVWLQNQPQEVRNKALSIFQNANVNGRYTVLPLNQVFAPMTLDAKNGFYRQAVVDYAEMALRQALDKAKLDPMNIDCLIITSCTGHMSPSLDAFLINRLNLKPTIQRMPIMEMGCVGGAAGLTYAENYLRAYPNHHVALIAAELCSITFQREDFSWANIVSTAIFGDGVACAILGPSLELKPRILDSQMYHFRETTNLLGFDLYSTGFHMVLDESLPRTIMSHFSAFMQPVLDEYGLTLESIDYFLVHPGGKAILEKIERRLRPHGKNLEDSRSILRQYGNVSSATILFILALLLDRPIPAHDKALLIGFGPGVTANTILLEWEE